MNDDYLMHIGKGHLDGGNSGRYPWGSGENPYQHESSFLNRVNELRKSGMTDPQIAKALGLKSSYDLRAKQTIEVNELRAIRSASAWKLHQKGYGPTEIGRIMGIPESTVRNYLNPHYKAKENVVESTANVLKKHIDEKGAIDIGDGTELELGVSKTNLKAATAYLMEKGYNRYYYSIPQVNNPENKRTLTVLASPDTEWAYINEDKVNRIHLIREYSNDGGLTYFDIEDPKSIDSKRVKVNYAEDGGKDKDGLIELRRGVNDISLGQSRYAQVRIAVDGTHYIKGMAVYSDDLPEGVDILFNTNKHRGTPMLGEKDNSVLKPLKDDPTNPFGSTVKQRYYIDTDGKEKLSPINIVREEGDWEKWSKKFSSQFLSKQNKEFARKQLDISYKDKLLEYEEIESLTNPSVKKRLLESFSDDCDSAACDLKACSVPRTSNYVILPFPEIKDNEIYAPNFNDGERVALVRHPHAGPFEIPELVVNNKYKGPQKVISKNAPDAVCINSKVAEKLSGADFDGDTVLVIPNNKGKIKSSPSLKGLEKFDPKESYPGYEGMKRMTKQNTQNEMGRISNLITDMNLRDATDAEMARAVRHSMVVIDAEKHNLDYRTSFKDNNISELKKKYQGSPTAGAATLISRSKAPYYVPQRRDTHKIDEEGRRIYKTVPDEKRFYINKKGEKVERQSKIKRMQSVDDAYLLSSGTAMESVYADYANKLKSLANKSRKEAYSMQKTQYSPTAKKTYEKEVSHILAQLNTAEKNKPLERKAHILANQKIKAMKDEGDFTNDEIKKKSAQELARARVAVGARKEQITLTPREWEAIQSGALHPTKLDRVLNNTDLDVIKQYATPRTAKSMTPAKIAKAKAMLANGCTQKEVADSIGVSVTTLRNNI